MSVGTKGEDTITRGTTITLQIKAGRIAPEVALDIAVAPKTVMTTAGTNGGTFPRIILTQSKNILEKNGNKIYH
jgi:hypothetical protein